MLANSCHKLLLSGLATGLIQKKNRTHLVTTFIFNPKWMIFLVLQVLTALFRQVIAD
jgi:hypothetical protein